MIKRSLQLIPAAASSAAVVILALSTGCASSNDPGPGGARADAPATGANEQEQGKVDELAAAAQNLQMFLDEQRAMSFAPEAGSATRPPGSSTPQGLVAHDSDAKTDDASDTSTGSADAVAADASAVPADAWRAEASANAAAEHDPARSAEMVRDDLAKRLWDAAGDAEGDPYRAALLQRVLDSLVPGAGGAPQPSALSAADSRLVDAAAAVIDAARKHDPSTDLAEVFERQARALRAGTPISIPQAALCTRITGFGAYDEWPGEPYRFVAGRTNAVLVYAEAANFSNTPVSGWTPAPGESLSAQPSGAGYVVETALEMELYHASDGALAWRQAKVTDRSFSRNERTDHYLAARVELPPTLTIGKYSFKVRITDGSAGSSAEAILPVEVVADERLIGMDSK